MTAPSPVDGGAAELPCPFCTGSDLASDWSDTNCRFLRCNDCGCTGPNAVTDNDAGIVWSHRAMPSKEVVDAIVGTLRQYIDDLRYPPNADSTERRIAAAERAIKQALALAVQP
jgi:hypothetical protein